MNSQTNNLFQVLVSSGNQAILAAGNTLDNLLLGQIGIFDARTNLSIDGTANVKDFYIAVAVDMDGDGVKDSIVKSAGQYIQGRNMTALTQKPYVAGQSMVFTVTGYEGIPDEDFGLKLEFRNSQISRTQGTVQFSKTFTTRTTYIHQDAVPTGDANQITIDLVNQINNDNSGLATAVPIARDAITMADHGTTANYTAGDVMTLADAETVFNFNKTADAADRVFTDIQITTVASLKNIYGDINLKYHLLRQTFVVPSLLDGFEVNGTITVTQDLVYTEGDGYDIQAKEYEAGGWNGNVGVYRTLSTSDVAKNMVYFASKTATYSQIALVYDFESVASTASYIANLYTLIAIPTTDATTKASFITALDLIAAQYGLETVAGTLPTVNAGVDGTVTNPVEVYTTAAATASGGTGGEIVSILWEQVGTTPAVATITGANTLTPDFSGLTANGTYTFKITVTDDEGNTASDTMEIVRS